MSKLKILFAGASGYKNTGDNAYKSILAHFLGDKYEITFTHPFPDRNLVQKADYVVIGGGGLIYDNKTSHFEYMSEYLNIAKASGIPFSFIGCGIQPMMKVGDFSGQDRWHEQIKRWIPYLEDADIVTVRSETDVEIIKKATQNVRVEYYPDLVYLIKPVNYHFFEPSKDYILFIPTVTDGHSSKFLAEWKEHEKYGDRRIVMTMAEEEKDYALQLANQINPYRGLNEFLDTTPEEACRIIIDSKKIITCRYHGLVIANAYDKEVITCDRRYKSIVEKMPKDKNLAMMHIKRLEEVIDNRIKK